MTPKDQTKGPGQPNPALAQQHPPMLQDLLLYIEDPEARDDIVRVYYGSLEGAGGSVALYHAVLLRAVYIALSRKIEAGIDALPQVAQRAAEQQSAVISRDVQAQVTRVCDGEQATRKRLLATIDDRLEETRRREAKVAEQRAAGRDRKLVSHGITALVAVVITAAVAYWLATKRVDEAVSRANARYAEVFRALDSGANFIAQLHSIQGSVSYQQTDTGSPRVVFDFGERTVAGAERTAPNQAIIDLAPYPEPSPVRRANSSGSHR